MSDLLREEFEAWAVTDYKYSLTRFYTDFRYDDDDTEAAWDAWQASRECLVIELPPSIGVAPIGGDGIQEFIDCNGEYLHGHLVVGALTAAGVKYK